MKHKHNFSRLVFFLCGYEAVALASKGTIPTLSALDAKFKHTLAPLLIGGLTAHLVLGWPKEENSTQPLWLWNRAL